MQADEDSSAGPDERVCPRCGAAAGFGSWCDSCGFELTSVERLPTRAEHVAASKDARPRIAAPQRQRVALILAGSLLAIGIAAAVAAVAGSGP